MKRIVKFLLLFGMIVSFTSWQSINARADIIQNPDGSVTINKEDIIKKIKIEGTTKPAIIEDGIVKYQLTEFKRDPQFGDGTVGAIYLEDRLSANDSFQFIGYMKSYHSRVGINPEIIGDGQSLIFHGDDSKFYGQVGSNLGILGLKNARGLVYDVFYNDKLDGPLWQSGEPLKDPGKIDTFYFQGWSTDVLGRGKRETSPVHYNKNKYVNSDKKRVVMNYNSTIREMKFGVSFAGFSETSHTLTIPKTQDYFYFASTASTGWATGTFDTYIESITYTPYRKKTIQYIDSDSKVELKQYQETKEVKLNEKYSFKPKQIPGYDVVDIEGKLEGTTLYEENLNDEFVKVYLRKQETAPTYELLEINNKTLTREIVNGEELLSVKGNELNPSVFKRPVSKITVTTPKEVTRDTNRSTVPFGWEIATYETETKNVYQMYNSNYSNVITEENSIKYKVDTMRAIENFSKFKVAGNVSVLDTKNIQLELSNYPIVFYENQKETIKTGYSFPKLYDVGFNENYAFKDGQYSPVIPINTSFLSHRGVKAENTSLTDSTSFIKDALGNKGVATTDNNLILGKTFTNNPILNYYVKYDISNGLSGSNEMEEARKVSIPQPVKLIMKDTLGNDLGTKEIETSYSLGDTIYTSESSLPKIPDYHFYQLEDSKIQFPIKVTNKYQEIVVIYEADKLYWGDVPWEFNDKTGELVFTGSGTFAEFTTSPWNRPDRYRVPYNKIKKIRFTSFIKAPQNSEQLFSMPSNSLSEVEYIEGLEKIDTAQATNMSKMFRGMSSLKELNVQSFNTNKVTNMDSMFNGLETIEELNISNFETSDKTQMDNMLLGMKELKSLRLGNKTVLKNTGLVTPKGDDYTGKWQSLGSGTAQKPLGTFVGTAIELENATQKSPGQETYVWEPVTEINMTINYLMKNQIDSKTKTFIMEDLAQAKRKEAYNEKFPHEHKSIESLLKDKKLELSPEFEGYDLDKTKTLVIIDESKEELSLKDQLPKDDFTINYYYDSKVDLKIPTTIDFGVRQKSDWQNIYAMTPNQDESNNKISIIDTFEVTNGKPNWSLYISTDGFYNQESGVRLLADIMLKSPEFSAPIFIGKEDTPIYKNANFFQKDISLIDKKQEEGLFVRVAKVQEIGKYNGVLKYKLEAAY